MKKRSGAVICTACRVRRNGNTPVGPEPLLRKNARTSSTSISQLTTCRRQWRTSTATSRSARHRRDHGLCGRHGWGPIPRTDWVCATCTEMCRNGPTRRMLGPSGPGRQLARQRPRLPGGGTLRAPADTPGHDPRLPSCPSSRPRASQTSGSKRPRRPEPTLADCPSRPWKILRPWLLTPVPCGTGQACPDVAKFPQRVSNISHKLRPRDKAPYREKHEGKKH